MAVGASKPLAASERAAVGAGRWTLYLAAAVVGGLTGLVGAAFRAMLTLADHGRELAQHSLETAAVPGWLPLMGSGALVLMAGLWLVRRFAPETAGSGIPQVEARLAGEGTLRWQRVLPIKFIAGIMAIGSGLVLGREGPTVHLGSALGQMVTDWWRLDEARGRTLIAAGAGAGLAAAFNAPLAAIVFVTEELREHFAYGFPAIQSVILACSVAVVVSGGLLGQGPILPIDGLGTAPLSALPLFLVLGVLIGALGVGFNRLLLGSALAFRALGVRYAYLGAGVVGMALGALLWCLPQAVGGGEGLVESLLPARLGALSLLVLLAVRLLTTVGSYGVGLPGGIFAPLLALGTISGAAFDGLLLHLAPTLSLAPGIFAVAAMGALFAATVRAPLTGVILVIELTGSHGLALPIILTCLAATFTAQGLGGEPIYSLLLEQGRQPPASVRAGARRLLIGALILVALVALDRVRSSGVEPGAGPPPTLDAVGGPGEARRMTSPASTPARRSANDQPTLAEAMPPPAESTSAPAPGPTRPAESGTDAGGRPPDLGQTRFTIQLISFRNAASLAPFARRHGIDDQARTLASRDAAPQWFPVLLGEYQTRLEAQDALARLPTDLRRLEPTVRMVPPGVPLEPVASGLGERH